MPTSVSPGKLVEAKLSTLERAQLYVMGWTRYLLPYVPGVALLVILAMTARLIGRNGLDSYTLVFAILLGILIRNTIGLGAGSATRPASALCRPQPGATHSSNAQPGRM